MLHNSYQSGVQFAKHQSCVILNPLEHAAEQLVHRLYAEGVAARRVMLPEGHDPNSFFVQGGDAREFQSLLEVAQP